MHAKHRPQLIGRGGDRLHGVGDYDHSKRPGHPNFGVFPLDQIVHAGVSPIVNFKLISREIIFEVFQPM